MHQTVLTSGRDAYLIGIPLILLMLIGLFRLDEAFLRPKKGPGARRRRAAWTKRDGRFIPTRMEKPTVSINQIGSTCRIASS